MKVCIIGLDGMSWQVFDIFADRLPNLRAIRDRGAWADLETVKPPVTAPAWVSFQTGQQVGNHGITSFEEYDSQFNFTLRDGTSLKSVTYYEILEQFGYRQLLINVPYSNPARIRGDIVHSWLTYRPSPQEMVHPANLFSQLQKLPPYLAYYKFAPEGSRRFFSQVVDYTTAQFNLLQEAIRKKSYDAVFCLNSATDGIQHAAYPDLRDKRKNSPGYKAMLKTLQTVDRFVGRLRQVDRECNLILVSDHGFQTYSGSFYVNQFLEQEGYLTYSTTGSKIDSAHQHPGQFISRFIILLRNHPLLLGSLKAIYSRFIKRLIKIDFRDVIDLESTVAYMPSPAEMMIHLRASPDGSPQDLAGIKKEIIEKINRLGIPVTAQSAEEFFMGMRALDKMPAIVLHSEGCFIRKDIGPEIFNREENVSWHSHCGIFAGCGPMFKKGYQIPSMHITDVIPTLFAGLNISPSESFDGTARLEALQNPPQEPAPPCSYPSTPPDSYEMSEEEHKKVAQRLKNLGYL